MKFNQYLEEEFETYVNPSNVAIDKTTPLPVFLNPTKREIAEISRGSGFARYILNFITKKLYVWDGQRALHDTVAQQLKINSYMAAGIGAGKPGWVYNDTQIENGKLDIVWVTITDNEKVDTDWLKQYFNHIKGFKTK